MTYFTENEISCRCGCGHNVTPQSFLDRIIKAREIAGIPFNVNSWNRCQYHNDKQPGSSKRSPHIRGIAVDIVTKDDTERFVIVNALLQAGFNRILIYPKRYFIHVDADETQEQYIMRIML
jgi:zinc D-Ala-D-Ala carboxypeptidase